MVYTCFRTIIIRKNSETFRDIPRYSTTGFRTMYIFFVLIERRLNTSCSNQLRIRTVILISRRLHYAECHNWPRISVRRMLISRQTLFGGIRPQKIRAVCYIFKTTQFRRIPETFRAVYTYLLHKLNAFHGNSVTFGDVPWRSAKGLEHF